MAAAKASRKARTKLMAKKRLPRQKTEGWVRTGGAIGDPTMEELDKYNREGAGVDSSKVISVDGDANVNLPVKRINPSEA